MLGVSPAAVAAVSFVSVLAICGPSPAATSFVLGQPPLATSCSGAALNGASSLRALEFCDRALSEEMLSPRDRAVTYVNLGVVLMNRREFAQALTAFEEGARRLEAEPADDHLGTALADRGIARIVAGQTEAGMADIDRGLALGLPRPEHAYYHRARAREQMNDLRGAYLDYRKAAELRPDWESPRQELARFRVVKR